MGKLTRKNKQLKRKNKHRKIKKGKWKNVYSGSLGSLFHRSIYSNIYTKVKVIKREKVRYNHTTRLSIPP
jgi:hypothetical protein